MRIPSIFTAACVALIAVANAFTRFETGGSNIFNENEPGIIGTNVSVFESDNILAEINFSGSEVTACRLSSIHRKDPKHVPRIAKLFPKRIQIDDAAMSNWVKLCGEKERAVLSETEFEKMRNMFEHEIALGTLWCGPGNIAPNYTFLGPATETDLCCRDHDFCPVCVPPEEHSYGLKEGHKYSVLSCDCDSQLHDCLGAAAEKGERIASIVLKFYFGMYDGMCLLKGRLGQYVPKYIKEVFNK